MGDSIPLPLPQSFEILRPVGNLERFSTARHSLGYYRCVINTARYRTDAPIQLLGSVIEEALAQVVLKYPALCCGIINEDRNDPAFVRLVSIDISSLIKYHTPDLELTEEDDIAHLLEHQHRQLFPNLDSLPGWRIIIVPTRKLDDTDGAAFDVVFAFHHAIGDGLSGMAFHRSLLEALNNPSDCPEFSNHILTVSESIQLAPAVEKKLKFQISWMFFLKAVWDEFRPRWLFPGPTPPWTGGLCLPEPIERYESHVKLITIAPDLVNPILAACREQKTTITGLLHGLVLCSLASRVPTATTFSAATAYSLRHLTGLSPTEAMGVHVSGLSSKCPPEVIASIRAAREPSQLMNQLWDVAREFRKAMASELAGLPNDNPIGMFPYVSNYHKMFHSKVGKPRYDTYEVSNVGTIKNAVPGAKWRIERVAFSQSGMAMGPGMGINVASVVGGPLTISVTWLEGDMDAQLMELIAKDVGSALLCVGEGREITLRL